MPDSTGLFDEVAHELLWKTVYLYFGKHCLCLTQFSVSLELARKIRNGFSAPSEEIWFENSNELREARRQGSLF